MKRGEAFKIIAAQKRLDLEKSECGRRLIAFYDAQATVYANSRKGVFGGIK